MKRAFATAAEQDSAKPLTGLSVLVVAGGGGVAGKGVSQKRSGLLLKIAELWGAERCSQAQDLPPGAGGVVACCPSLKEDTLLKALQGCPDRQGLTIVDTAWISSCAEKKARVPFDDYLIHGKRPRAGDTATHNVPAACEPGRASLLDTRFCRGNHYLNLLPGEVWTPRHVSFEELLPEDCDCALFTSLFPDRAYEWLRSKCNTKAATLNPKLVLLIAETCPKLPPGQGSPRLCERDEGWLLLAGQRTSGMLHCSLLLFRTATMLRVVIGGTNLDGQMQVDRDALFVMDFPVRQSGGSGAARAASRFGQQLAEFLHYIPYAGLPGPDLKTVHTRINEVLQNVEFSSADGSCGLVTSMPGGPRDLDKGGWLQLGHCLSAWPELPVLGWSLCLSQCHSLM